VEDLERTPCPVFATARSLYQFWNSSAVLGCAPNPIAGALLEVVGSRVVRERWCSASLKRASLGRLPIALDVTIELCDLP
jgi:hypothetical protein